MGVYGWWLIARLLQKIREYIIPSGKVCPGEKRSPFFGKRKHVAMEDLFEGDFFFLPHQSIPHHFEKTSFTYCIHQYVCMYVCMYVSLYLCMYVRKYKHIYIYTLFMVQNFGFLGRIRHPAGSVHRLLGELCLD